jgi:uncharacterized protein YndB with AHSA1/START domain
VTDYEISWLDDTHREVRRRRIPAGEARTAFIRRHYDAAIEDVWDACTDPDRLSRWFLRVAGDLRLGGTFSLAGNASGEILRCEPPRLLSVSWAYGDQPVGEVELRLSPGDDGDTVLELEHATVSEAVEWEGKLFDAILGVGSGWEPALTYGLTKYLRGELSDGAAADHVPDRTVIEELSNRSAEAWAALVDPDPGPIER